MSLIETVETILNEKKRNMSWLASELDRTPEGFKLSLKNETIKYSDLKKMMQVLNVPINVLFESGSHIQNIKGNNNTQAMHSRLNEPDSIYNKKEVEGLQKQVELLESQLADKNEIIKLLREK